MMMLMVLLVILTSDNISNDDVDVGVVGDFDRWQCIK